MAKIHVSLSYHHIHLDVLDVFAIGVRDGIYGNAGTFATPPITQAAFQVFIDDYINTRGAYVQGGLAQKGPFLAAKTALITTLDDFATYVDGIAKGDANIITLAGFVPTKPGGTAGHAPAQPLPALVTRGASGELFAECPVVAGADSYGCLAFAGFPMPSVLSLNAVGQLIVQNTKDPMGPPMPPQPNGIIAFFDLNKSRKKKFVGLQPHVVYYFYFYTSNASGVSPISEVSSLECI